MHTKLKFRKPLFLPTDSNEVIFSQLKKWQNRCFTHCGPWFSSISRFTA